MERTAENRGQTRVLGQGRNLSASEMDFGIPEILVATFLSLFTRLTRRLKSRIPNIGPIAKQASRFFSLAELERIAGIHRPLSMQNRMIGSGRI